MASEAIWGNVHMNTRVIKVADFKFEVKWPPRPFDVIEHHMPISHSPCRRRYIGPLPSCSWNRDCLSIRAVITTVMNPNPDLELRCFLRHSLIPIPTPTQAKIWILIAVIGAGSESGFGIKVVFGHSWIPIPIRAKNGVIITYYVIKKSLLNARILAIFPQPPFSALLLSPLSRIALKAQAAKCEGVVLVPQTCRNLSTIRQRQNCSKKKIIHLKRQRR